jgi:predicted MFS family arabinose efflux permease
MAEATQQATYRDLFAIGEFRVLWLAQVTSVAGDQLARVALTVLVYDRTHSPLLAALTYVASIVPLFVGGVLLSGIADRLPRRGVMIGCDLGRAVLVVLMVIPGMPLAALIVLLAVVTLLGAPFQSARTAMLPDILPGHVFALGQAVSMTTYQLAQVAGFAVGGVVAGLLGTRTSLLADAVSFAVSALLVWHWVQARRLPARHSEHQHRLLADLGTATRLVFTNRALRTPMLLGWLSAFYNVPDGVAAPLAHALGGGAVTVGIILTAQALGATAGRIGFTRWVEPGRQRALMGPLAILASAVLILLAARPGLTGSLLILTASGVLACFQAPASADFVAAAPPQRRGQAFGLAIAGMNLGQGTAMLLAGVAAGYIAPALVIALAGAAGTAAAIAIALTDRAKR